MFKRTALIFLSLIGFLALGIVIAPQAGPAPLSAHPANWSAPAERAAVWVRDGITDYSGRERLVALDATTGDVLLQTAPPASGEITAISSDGRWQYVAYPVMNMGGSLYGGPSWQILLAVIDLRHGVISQLAPAVELPEFPSNARQNPSVQLALSEDNRRLALIVTAPFGGQWYSSIYLVDTDSTQSGRQVGLFMGDATSQRPSLWATWTRDGRKLIVIENYERASASGGASNRTVRLVLFTTSDDLKEGVTLVGSKDVTGELQSNAQNLVARLSPDNQSLYLIEPIYKEDLVSGYHFVAYDVNKLEVLRAETVHGSTFALCDPNVQFTPDARYLYEFCSSDVEQPNAYFRFLDTQTGLVSKRITLPEGIGLNEGEFAPQLIHSPDQKQVFVLNPGTHALSVLDVEHQTIVSSERLKSDTALLNRPRWLESLLLHTASAKGSLYFPSAAVSPDAQRLYFADVSQDHPAVWAVETRSLQVIGRWLKGKYIPGLQLSPDGRELYALSQGDHALYVLDALTGNTLRVFDQVLKQPHGFAP